MLKKILIVILVIIIVVAIAFFAMLLKKASDSQKIAPLVGIQANGLLLPCPDKPNCVATDGNIDDPHFIEPLDASLWQPLTIYLQQANVQLVKQESNYIHITYKTPLLGFIDDVEFQLRPTAGIIAIRSASRQGYSDLDTNRKRIETIRKELTPN